jgi:hypothetical protein
VNRGQPRSRSEKAVTWAYSLVTAYQVGRPRQDSNLRTRLRRARAHHRVGPGSRGCAGRDQHGPPALLPRRDLLRTCEHRERTATVAFTRYSVLGRPVGLAASWSWSRVRGQLSSSAANRGDPVASTHRGDATDARCSASGVVDRRRLRASGTPFRTRRQRHMEDRVSVEPAERLLCRLLT